MQKDEIEGKKKHDVRTLKKKEIQDQKQKIFYF